MSPADSDKAYRYFDQQLAEVRELLLQMASKAEDQVRAALEVVKERDAQGANLTIETDHQIDALEIEIEERAINLLARQQPMAIDLRMLVAILKISNDLERVGDHAVNIAQCAKRLAEAYPIETIGELDLMAEDATDMLRDAIGAFVEENPDRARDVLTRDDRVDRHNDVVFRVMLERMAENTNTIVAGLQMMLVARNLERVADLATNLAEDVIYVVEARTIKHHVADHETEGSFDQ
jgi:phosphate transport system protein